MLEAQRLLDAGRPFHAHEVLEAAWKTAPDAERELWKGLAQLAVGATHALRGNRVGAVTLLRRGSTRIAGYADAPPYGIDISGLVRTANEAIFQSQHGNAGPAPTFRLVATQQPSAVRSEADKRGFLPSRDAFRFRNAFGGQPVVRFGRLRIGRAGNGLCGGMVFAARDYFEAEVPIPTTSTVPESGTPLFRYLVIRLLAAFNGPVGIGRYWRWMMRSDADVLRRTRNKSSPAVRDVIDGGHPCPIGVVTARGGNPARLRYNHVVLAFGCQIDGTGVTLNVYDPNTGPSDDVVIRSDSRAITSTIDVGNRIRGYFPLRYRPWRPPLIRSEQD